jgi:hypothetical protein
VGNSTGSAQNLAQPGRTIQHWNPALGLAGIGILILFLLNLYWASQITALKADQQEIARQLDDHTNVLALIGAGETYRFELSSTDRTTHALMLCNPDESLGFIYTEDFAPRPPGMAYYVWLVHDQERINVGTFILNKDGEGMLIFHASEPVGNYDTAEITLETLGTNRPNSPVLVSALLDY